MFELTLSTLGALGGVFLGWTLRERAGLESEDLVKALEKLTSAMDGQRMEIKEIVASGLEAR